MFTGIIAATSKVNSVKGDAAGLLLRIAKPKHWKVKIGDSIAVNGVCSTVKQSKSGLLLEYMPETVARTNLLKLKKGEVVNLEQALLATGRLDGHLVQGHIDGIGTIAAIAKEGNSRVLTISPSARKLMKFIAEKGAVAIDGISLTITSANKNYFAVKVIPYTLQHTNLRYKKRGATVNIECDIMAKYLDKIANF